MRIAVIADPLDNQNAGVHTYTRHLVNSLITHRGNHDIILIREKIDPTLNGCHQIAIPNTRLPVGYASFRLFFKIPQRLKKEKVDVVIEPAHFGPFNLPKNILRVTMIHDLTPILFPHWHRWHSQWLQRIFLKDILRKTDIILSNSHNTSRDIARIYPFSKEKIKTIHLGVDPFFQPTDSRHLLDELGIRDRYFHFVGTIEPRKDLKTLLKAFSIFRDQSKHDVQLVIAGGKGWNSNDFYEALDIHPYKQDIMLTGYVSKEILPQLHSHSLALIYPSQYEGFGLPVLEGLACGANVITGKNSSLTEVGSDQANYFETGDAVSLSRAMFQVMNLEVTPSLIEERLQWAAQFRWDHYALALIEQLETGVKSKTNE